MTNTDIVNDNELNSLAEQLLNEYRKALKEKDSIATGSLAYDATKTIRIEGDHIAVYFNLNDYWKYVENGRRPGKFPPIDKIREWIQIKNIIPRMGPDNKIPSTDQLAFLISRKIAREGIEGKHQLETTLDNNDAIINKFIERLGDLLEIEITNIINTI